MRCGALSANQRWLWHAIDHSSGEVLAFGIMQFYTDGWGAYERHLDASLHTVGKRNTQQIERKHLTLRTRIKRLVRKTICFSKSILMHNVVIGLFINRLEFGLNI